MSKEIGSDSAIDVVLDAKITGVRIRKGAGGESEILDNGNVITNDERGTLFEFSPNGTLVWKFVNKVSGNEVSDFPRFAVYPRDYLADVLAAGE